MQLRVSNAREEGERMARCDGGEYPNGRVGLWDICKRWLKKSQAQIMAEWNQTQYLKQWVLDLVHIWHHNPTCFGSPNFIGSDSDNQIGMSGALAHDSNEIRSELCK